MRSWMKSLPDTIKLSQINLPGTHNSGAFKVNLSYFSKCQNMTIADQLNSGLRFFDIRVEKLEDELKLVHGVTDCKNPEKPAKPLLLRYVVKTLKNFLSENPSEVILFSFNRDDGASSEETFDLFFEKYLSDDTLWYKENRIPTLKEVRGKIVLLNRCHLDKNNEIYTDMNTGINLTNWVYQKDNTDRIYEYAELLGKDKNLTGTDFMVQDLYGLTPQKKWQLAIAPFIKNPPEADGILISFFSCITTIYNPRRSAKYINKRLAGVTLDSTKKYGWIILDYPTKDFIKKVIDSNF